MIRKTDCIYVVVAIVYCYILFPTQTKYVFYRLGFEGRRAMQTLDTARKAKRDRLVLASETYHIGKIMDEGSEGLSAKLGL